MEGLGYLGAGVGVGAQTHYSTYTEMYWHAVHNSCINGSNNAPLYAALDFVDSAMAFPGGQFIDLLGTPKAATRWLVERGLAPIDAELR